MRPEGQVSRGKLWLSETELRGKFTIGGGGGGGLTSNALTSTTKGYPGACCPWKILILSPLKWLQMHLKLTWCGETYILSTTKKVAIKIYFLHKELCSFNGSFNILQATQRVGSSMSTLTGIGQLHDDVVLLQLFSCANYSYCSLILSGIDKFK